MGQASINMTFGSNRGLTNRFLALILFRFLPACRQCVALKSFVRKHRSRSRRYGEDRGSGEGGIGGRTELVGLVMPVAPPAALPGVNDKGAARRQHGIEIHFRCRELGSAAGALDENAAGVAVNACRLRVRR